MFAVEVKPTARRQLARLRRFHAAAIVSAMQRYLTGEPERPRSGRIKKLRGRQDATYRLRVGEYRVFYDVADDVVTVVAVLHKTKTPKFYRKDGS